MTKFYLMQDEKFWYVHMLFCVWRRTQGFWCSG